MLRSLGNFVLARSLLISNESVCKVQFCQGATCDQKSDTVGGCPVGETMLNSVALEFVTVGCAENFVTSDLGGDNLANDVFVGEADDEAVFRRVVFVLGLGDETLAGIVVGLPGATTLVLGLVAATLL